MGFASLKGPWAPKRQKLCRPRSSTAIRSPNNRHRTGDGPEPRGSRSSTTRPRGANRSTPRPRPRSRRGPRSPAGRFGPGDISGHFPNDEAAAKSIYLAQTATPREWRRLVRQWQAVKASAPSCSKTTSQWRRRSTSAQNSGQSPVNSRVCVRLGQRFGWLLTSLVTECRQCSHRREAGFRFSKTRVGFLPSPGTVLGLKTGLL